MNKKNLKFHIIAIICIIIFGIALAPKTLQNDTFYTIKIGEHISQNGIDMMDPFSWHKDMSYTYPHWLYDYATYWIYHFGGMQAIYIVTAALGCILGITMYYTNSKITKNNLTSFLLTLGAMWMIRGFIAARAQLVTFILFVLEVYFIECFIQSKKKRYAAGLAIISLLIANLHVAVWPFFFVLFLPYIAEGIIIWIRDKHFVHKLVSDLKKDKIRRLGKKSGNEEKIKQIEIELAQYEEEFEKFKKKQEELIKNPYRLKIEKKEGVKYLVVILIIAALMGLLTPIKDTPYTYLIKTMQGNTTQSINEHLPTVLIENKPVLYTIVIGLAILIFTDTKIRLRDLFMISGLVVLTLMSKRQASIYVIIGAFVLNKLICDIFQKYDSEGSKKFEKYITKPVGFIVTIVLTAALGWTFIEDKLDDPYISEASYPVQAAEYIKENLDLENIKLFNEYNYGSYLLFKEIPVFIDSRADLYAPEFNEKDIFSDFLNISGISVYYEDKFSEYGITHIIIGKKTRLTMLLSKDENYKEIYSDDNFIIYERLK